MLESSCNARIGVPKASKACRKLDSRREAAFGNLGRSMVLRSMKSQW
jgi:hypothetical protein